MKSVLQLTWDISFVPFASTFAFNVAVFVLTFLIKIINEGAALGLVTTLLPHYITKFSMFLLWLLYISLYTVGQTFLHFQWDILLLETGELVEHWLLITWTQSTWIGILAIIASPLRFHQHKTALVQDSITMYLVRWLLFRHFPSCLINVHFLNKTTSWPQWIMISMMESVSGWCLLVEWWNWPVDVMHGGVSLLCPPTTPPSVYPLPWPGGLTVSCPR